MRFFLLLFLFLSASCNGQNSGNVSRPLKKPTVILINYNIPIFHLLDSLKLNKTQASLFVKKSSYRLEIRVNNQVVKSYPVVFGFNPVDDKLKEGDGCTPEGVFKIKAMYPHKSWSKFIWFDYPNDASRVKYNNARKKGIIPKESKIGGDVGIHGVPKGADDAIDQHQNWTLGCVSLKNKDIDEIYSFAFVGMKIEIVK
jgi:murein L,D-transpeptidase YafK